jgi:hypothetical protein
VTVLYDNNFYLNWRGLFVPVVMMMVVVTMFPTPTAAGGAIRTTGYLVHLVFGQILQW